MHFSLLICYSDVVIVVVLVLFVSYNESVADWWCSRRDLICFLLSFKYTN